MASEPDDNPFARVSAWPSPPRAPFRVGPLPKAAPAPAPVPEQPPAITPVFVRPIGPPPPPAPPASPVRPEPEPMAVAPPPRPEAPPVYSRPRTPRRSPLPAVAATVVGVIGVAGLIFLFGQGRQAGPEPAPRPPEPAAAQPVSPASGEMAVKPPSLPVAARAIAPKRLVPRPAAAAATEEANSTPVLILPPAQAVVPAPAPAFNPPPAPDPSAPMVTRGPD